MHTTLGRMLQAQMHGSAPAGNGWGPVHALNAASLATVGSKGSHTDKSVPLSVVSNAVLSAADTAVMDVQRGSKLTRLTAVAQTHATKAGSDWASMPSSCEQSSTHTINFAGQPADSTAALQLGGATVQNMLPSTEPEKHCDNMVQVGSSHDSALAAHNVSSSQAGQQWPSQQISPAVEILLGSHHAVHDDSPVVALPAVTSLHTGKSPSGEFDHATFGAVVQSVQSSASSAVFTSASA